MKLLHSLKSNHYRSSAVFEVPIKNGVVYMCADRSNYMNEERHVTIVDAQKFLNHWSLEPHGHNAHLSRGNSKNWISDRKYPDAAEGFSKGISNPVPLANVVCSINLSKRFLVKKRFLRKPIVTELTKKEIIYVDFINGITRTIWLLANGASSFPIECGINDGLMSLVESCSIDGVSRSVLELTS